MVVIEELGIEIDRDTVSEAVLWTESGGLLGLGLELEREDVEAIVGPTDCAEDDGAFGNGMIHLRVCVVRVKVEIKIIISINKEKRGAC